MRHFQEAAHQFHLVACAFLNLQPVLPAEMEMGGAVLIHRRLPQWMVQAKLLPLLHDPVSALVGAFRYCRFCCRVRGADLDAQLRVDVDAEGFAVAAGDLVFVIISTVTERWH